MSDLNRILNQLLNSGAASGFAGGLAGSMAGSMLSGKSGRKLGKKAIKYGGLAAVGALAYAAYKNYSDKSAPALPGTAQQALSPPPAGSGFLPGEEDAPARDALGLTLVRAMIAAGRADGRLDSEESQTIFTRIQALDLSAEEKSLLVSEMERPVDMDEIVRSAESPEIASEIYTASLLAIDVDDPAESAYLAMLAARLRLPAELVSEIHRQAQAE